MLPSDDFWPRYSLEKQILHFDDDRIVLVFGNMSIVNHKSEVIGKTKVNDKIKNIQKLNKFEALDLYLTKNFVCQPTVLIRSSTLSEIGGYFQKVRLSP